VRARVRSLFLSALLALAAAGCARRAGPPPISPDAVCAACGMQTSDLRFACEREVDGHWRAYDSIECMARDPVAGPAFLADYDTRTLHPADSLWVVKGSFPSPMGGGYAAFRSRAVADRIAAATSGFVGRFASATPPQREAR
jgi:nitrous oxide reductase accessory protein NosL